MPTASLIRRGWERSRSSLVLPRRIECDQVEQQQLLAIESRTTWLRLAFLRVRWKNSRPSLEKRRIGLVAIEISRQFVLQAGTDGALRSRYATVAACWARVQPMTAASLPSSS